MKETESRLRIAHATSAHPWSDVRIFLKEARYLASKGHDVTVVAQNCDPTDIDGVHRKPLKKASGRLERMILGPMRTLSAARQFDVIHFHDPELMPVALVLKLLGKKIIYDVHEDMPSQVLDKHWLPSFVRGPVSRLVGLLEAVTARCADAVVVATPTIKKRFPPAKTFLVRNFADLTEFEASPGMPYQLRPNELLYIGGISESRGALDMIRAMGDLDPALGARLILAGSCSPPDLISRLSTEAGWSTSQYLGIQGRREVGQLLGRARAGLLVLHPAPNHIESLPVKLFEYMMAGLPVIASDFPLWRSMIGQADAGLMVPPNDPSALSKAMDWILRNPDQAREMGQRGRKAVELNFNWKTEAQSLLSAYEFCLGKASPRDANVAPAP